MKERKYCGLCGQFLGELHGYERGSAMKNHFKEVHPRALALMKKARKELDELKKQFGYTFTFADESLRH